MATKIYKDKIIERLKTLYPDTPNKDIAKKLKMPVNTVASFARDLGLKKNNPHSKKYEPGDPRPWDYKKVETPKSGGARAGAGHPEQWDGKATEQLIAMATRGGVTAMEISLELQKKWPNCTRSAVLGKLRRLGISLK